MARGLVIAGTHSSVGKTTVSLGVMAAFKARGLTVQPFKVGPDFIDPGHHSLVCGRPSRNLDGWMLSKEANLAELAAGLEQAGQEADLVLVEGVMGLFDGLSGDREDGSTAQMAKWLNLPVVLVVDARSMARSAGAVILGFERFDPGLTLAGVIFNRVGSRTHLEMLKEAVGSVSEVPVLGGLGREEAIVLQERHLGLTTAQEKPLDPQGLESLTRMVTEGLDLDRVWGLAGPVPSGPAPARSGDGRVRIGLAWDKAFCFYYQANLDLLRAAGAELVPFSPLAGEIPREVKGLYLGGGYPELFAADLARGPALKDWLRELVRAGLPVYAECGGLMYLGRELTDLAGEGHPMAGVLPFSFTMEKRLRALGYREVELTRDCLLGPAGLKVRGHEFHYSHLDHGRGRPSGAYLVRPGRGGEAWEEGYQDGRANLLGSYVHLHFGSEPRAAFGLVRACREYKERAS